MWNQKQSIGKERKELAATNQLVCIAIDKDRGSQVALRWAIENLIGKGQTAILIHVKLRSSSYSTSSLASPKVMSASNIDNGNDNLMVSKDVDLSTRDLVLPFRIFCTRNNISCKDIVVEDLDVAKALIEYVTQAGIENLVVGSTTKSGFLRRFKTTDIPSSVVKGAPDFCNVYVISRGKVQTMRSTSRPAPTSSITKSHSTEAPLPPIQRPEKPSFEVARRSQDNIEFRSPFTRKGYNGKMLGDTRSSSRKCKSDTDTTHISNMADSISSILLKLDDLSKSLNNNSDCEIANMQNNLITELKTITDITLEDCFKLVYILGKEHHLLRVFFNIDGPDKYAFVGYLLRAYHPTKYSSSSTHGRHDDIYYFLH